MRTLPLIAILLGVAGLIPFAAGGLAAVSLTGDAGRVALLALAAYGAVILAFLGGVHWGIGLEAGSTQTVAAQRARFGLGVLPSLAGWAGLLAAIAGLPKTGLTILAAGFVALTIAEARGARSGLVPTGYMALRWVLSVVVIVCLVSVILVLSLGGHVIL